LISFCKVALAFVVVLNAKLALSFPSSLTVNLLFNCLKVLRVQAQSIALALSVVTQVVYHIALRYLSHL
jgi:hypothetical protein